MPLADELTATVEHVRGALPAHIFDAIQQATVDLGRTDLVARAAGVGARPHLPSLPDATGVPVDLAGMLARGPLVLTFYRGGWCPYCNVALQALQRVLPDIRALGAELVAVTPELADRIETTAGRIETDFPVLHDAHNAFARTLGLVFELPEAVRAHFTQIGIELPEYNGDATFSLPVPATYVIGRDGEVAWAFVDTDFTRRAEPDDVLAVLRALPSH